MMVHRELAGSLPEFRNAVVTIGAFDGVHLGHQQIIAQLRKEATLINGETVIITFHPHPRKIVTSVPGDIRLLNTLQEKIDLLDKAGIDHLVVVPFDHRFSNQPAEAYIHDFLYHYFRPHTIIIGYDHRFGKGREGDYQLLEAYGKKLGFEVKEIPEQLQNEIVISSTRIRNAIAENDIETANALLGYPYFFEGLIVEGNQLGRTIGYPTANLHITSEEKLVPGDGVYAVSVNIKNQTGSFNGMMNIGIRPTIGGKKRVIEVNIFDFDATVYGDILQVQVHRFLRGEIKFNGLEELKTQLQKDKEMATALLLKA
jgi:riboflavin kinase/FMN adenylyltransferase